MWRYVIRAKNLLLLLKAGSGKEYLLSDLDLGFGKTL